MAAVIKLVCIGVFAVFVLPRLYLMVKFMDFGENVFNHRPGPCHLVKGANTGSEDIELIPETNIALISAGYKHGTMIGDKSRKGTILYFDFDEPEDGAKSVKFKNFKGKELSQFNPHGISIFKSDYKTVLFVVSNRWDNNTVVERFEVNKDTMTLKHLQTISSPEFRFVNDLTATGENSFYFTNHMYYNPGTFLGRIENYVGLRFASVGYYNGKQATILLDGLLMPNGITQSVDRKYLYLATMADALNLHVFEMDRKRHDSLKLVQQKEIPTHIDNINVDPDTGDVWLGCQPIGWQLATYLDNHETAVCASQVLKIKTNGGLLTDDVKEVYVNNGDVISASSVAWRHKKGLLIGSVCHNTVYCKIKHV